MAGRGAQGNVSLREASTKLVEISKGNHSTCLEIDQRLKLRSINSIKPKESW